MFLLKAMAVSTPGPARVARGVWSSAWTLLVLTNLLWAGNIVLARGVAGVVPPVALAYWRWTGAFLLSLPFAWPLLRRDMPALLRHWRVMLLLAATGIATYNTVSYVALNHTTALNVLLLQSATPLMIVALALVIFAERPTGRQIGGIVLSLCGVAVIAAHGSLAALIALRINPGDLMVIGALAIYSVYCVVLRRRPLVHPLSFLSAVMGLGSLMMLPFYVWERASGAHVEGGWDAVLSMAYMAIFPSLIAYLLFNRAVELIGSNAAGHSMHLMPLFGSVLAVLFLHEQFRAYHAGGIALIGGGILLASLPLERFGADFRGRWRMRTLIGAAALAMLAGLGGPALAETTPAAPPTPQPPSQPATPKAKPAPPPSTTAKPEVEPIDKHQVVAILGRPVFGAEKQQIGTLADVLVDGTGQPQAAVLDIGGFMGLGQRTIAVHWNLLHFNPSDQKAPITLSLTLDQIKETPEYKGLDNKPAPVVVRSDIKPTPAH